MNILVTGAAGYIGSICAELLIAKGMNVVALDNLQEGHREAVPEQAVFCRADLANRADLDQLFSAHRIDAVMHFAGEALVAKSVREPSTFYAGNVACGVTLLDAMTRHGVRKLVFSSTCAVYGEPRTVPIPEDHPKAPVNPYGKSKLAFEGILADYRAYTGLDYVALRYFNVAGASEKRGEAHREETHLLPNIFDAALANTPVSIFGTDYPTPDGTCIRDYVHVSDIAEAHFRALEALATLAGNAYNVGSGRGYSIIEVLDATRKIIKRAIPEQRLSRRPGDPAVLVANGGKLKHALGWSPAGSTLEEIISSAWKWKLNHPAGYSKS